MKMKSFSLLGCLGILMLSGIVVAQASVGAQESAKDAWANLAGRFANRPEFAFVENNPALPNVLIYGDSISIGYTQRVRAKIGGQANVYRLYHNGGSSRSFIPMMTKMHNTMRDEQLDKPWTFQWDVIHFNVGLHDLTVKELDEENGTHVSATPIDVYKKNFSDIVTYLQQLAPNAKLIFATTTPVPEGTFGPRRVAGDARRYNVAALEVLRKTPDIVVNDLFSFTKPNHPQWWSEPGNVHYNETGKNAQGDEVARVILSTLAGAAEAVEIKPTWESMAQHYDVPDWFLDGKIGIWSHWGPMSAVEELPPGAFYARFMYAEVPDSGELSNAQTKAKWHLDHYGHPSEFGWEKFVPMFRAEKWDPDALVKLFKDNGACFIMPVACHHDNFDMYDSSHPWNSVDMGPKRDVVGGWKAAAVKHGLKFGVSTHLWWSPGYWSGARKYQQEGTLEWKLFNMDYSARGYASQDSWNEHWYDRCWEIIEKYDPDMFNNDCPYPSEEKGKNLGLKLFTAYLNRDLQENGGKQTVVLSFKDKDADRAAFTYNLERGGAGEIQPEPWIWATDLSGGWGYRKGAVNKMSIPVMLGNAIDVISKNGVAMLNVALRGDGTLPESQESYLKAFGAMLRTNAEGIYGSRPWKIFGEGPHKTTAGRQGENKNVYSQQDIRFTTKGGCLYAFVLAKPTEDVVIKTLANGDALAIDIKSIGMLGNNEAIHWSRSSDGLTIKLPKILPGDVINGFKITLANDTPSDRHQRDDRALLISNGSRFVPQDIFPKFSWDTTPVYHMFGDKERVLTQDEVDFIAKRTDFLCIEKSHGYGQLGAAELGAKHDAAAFKKANPGMKVLFYFNAALAWPYTSYSKDFTRGRIDSSPKLKEFLIANSETGALPNKHGAFLFNVLNPEFREWWVDTVAKGVEEAGCDGAFIDQMHGNANLMRGKGREIELAMGELMSNLKGKLGPDKILLANNANAANAKYVYPVSDALMFENFSEVHFSKENILADWNGMLRNAREGKVSVFRLGVEGHGRGFLRSIPREEKFKVMPKISQEKLEYALACYLIGAQPYSYFMYSWGWTLGDGALVDYPELERPLGPPNGAYQRTTPDGWEFTREFEHANVWVNTETRKAKITWR